MDIADAISAVSKFIAIPKTQFFFLRNTESVFISRIRKFVISRRIIDTRSAYVQAEEKNQGQAHQI